MRARVVVPLLLSALTACTSAPREEATPAAGGRIDDVMVLGTRGGSLIVRSDSGSVRSPRSRSRTRRREQSVLTAI